MAEEKHGDAHGESEGGGDKDTGKKKAPSFGERFKAWRSKVRPGSWVVTGLLVVGAVAFAIIAFKAAIPSFQPPPSPPAPTAANPSAPPAQPPAKPGICTREDERLGKCSRGTTPPAQPTTTAQPTVTPAQPPTTQPAPMPAPTPAPATPPGSVASKAADVRCDGASRTVTDDKPIVGLSGCVLITRVTASCVVFDAGGQDKATMCPTSDNVRIPPSTRQILPTSGQYTLRITACPPGRKPVQGTWRCG